MLFRQKLAPYAHQAAEFEAYRGAALRGLFWEMGCGKTKAVLDSAAHLWLAREIDALLVLAPNGVHQNWILDEVPAHLSDDVPRVAHAWASKSSGTKWQAAVIANLLSIRSALPILAMSYDAFRTAPGRRAAEAMLNGRRCMYVLDESQFIKSPGAKRTISVVATGRRARYKRILSGTPVTNRPFDIYAQMKFLDEGFWRARGFDSYEAFQTYFAVLVDRETSAGGRYRDVVSYRHLDRLRDLVAAVSSRVTKDEALDLPPKIYQRRYFELSGEQERAYAAIVAEFQAFLTSGAVVTAPLVVTRLLRLQQISSGFVPTDDEDPADAHDFAENPRLDCLMEELEDLEGKAIIWARFRRDVDKVTAAIAAKYGVASVVRYDGAVDDGDRLAARNSFQNGASTRFFVANPAVGGTGLTLTAARTIIYYSNSFNWGQRAQSEDRAHRIGQTGSVRIVDLIGEGTIDGHITAALQRKADIAALIVGDRGGFLLDRRRSVV